MSIDKDMVLNLFKCVDKEAIWKKTEDIHEYKYAGYALAFNIHKLVIKVYQSVRFFVACNYKLDCQWNSSNLDNSM